jgi:hypothetical protein
VFRIRWLDIRRIMSSGNIRSSWRLQHRMRRGFPSCGIGGGTSYLEVLTNETNAFSAELGLAQAQLNELS